MDNGQFSYHSLSIINEQFSILSYDLFCKLSIVNYQLSIIHCPLHDSAIAGLMRLYRH